MRSGYLRGESTDCSEWLLFEATAERLVWTSIHDGTPMGAVAWSDIESVDVDDLGNVDLYGAFGEIWDTCRLRAG